MDATLLLKGCRLFGSNETAEGEMPDERVEGTAEPLVDIAIANNRIEAIAPTLAITAAS